MTALDRLRTIAEQATEGPWSVSGYDDAPTVYGAAYRGTWVVADVRDGGLDDETFIATFDPATVLALLDVAEAAERLTSGKVMGAVHDRAGRDANYCDSCLRSWPCEGSLVADALDRLREVAL